MNIDVKKYDKEIKQLLYDEIKKTHQYFLPFALLEF